VQSLIHITQNIDQIVRATGRNMLFSYRQTMECLFEDELRSMRTHTVLPADNSSTGAVDWWSQHGSQLPLLQVFARIAIVTGVGTVELERQFSCQSKLLFCIERR
jgi:hypothetical protein